ILRYFQLTEHDEYLVQLIEQELDKDAHEGADLIQSIGDTVSHKLFQKTRRPQKSSAYRRWLPYAAAILLFSIGAIALYQYKLEPYVTERDVEDTLATEELILPGGNRATVTLQNGQVLTLSEDQEGVI